MAILEYNVEVIQTKSVCVKIDTDKINEEFLKEFSSYMWEVDCVEDIVKHIARCDALGFDPEGVGSLKGCLTSDKEALKEEGFVSNTYYEDEEVEIL